MNPILEDIQYSIQDRYSPWGDPAYRESATQWSNMQKELMPKLGEELLVRFQEALSAYMTAEFAYHFTTGYRVGVQLMLAADLPQWGDSRWK